MVRSFRTEHPGRGVIESLVDLASRAPSAGKVQGWHAIALDGARLEDFWRVTLPPERRDSFAWPGLLRAPVVLIVLADPDEYVRRYAEPDKRATGLGGGRDRWQVPYWLVDASFASMVAMLAAVDSGLGTLFFAVADEPAVRREFAVPDRMLVVGALAIGVPDGDDRKGRSADRPRRTPAEILRWGGWA
jgi:nitroreductase